MKTELKNGVYWVGVVDWGLRHFHGHELSTPRGSAYNAFVIRDEKNVLIDTVWEPFTKEFLDNVREVIDPAKIDYVVVNHAEPDHSGALPALMKLCSNATILCSRKGMQSIPGHYHGIDWKLQPVKTGDTLSIGRRELRFIEAPMVHWPDTMFTHVSGDNILIPNDAFGQHFATAYRWNDQVDQAALFDEALRYYANIITPFSKLVTKTLDQLAAMNLPIEMICPSHGVMWRDNPMQIVEQYVRWARQEPDKSAVILYDTMWEATRRMAEAVSEGMQQAGVPHKLLHLALSDRTSVLAEIFKAKAIIIGSPTVNHGVLPSISPILEDLKGLRFLHKVGAAFGAYGWSGEAVAEIEEIFTKCEIPVVAPGVKAMWQPAAEDLEKCRQLGAEVAKAVLA